MAFILFTISLWFIRPSLRYFCTNYVIHGYFVDEIQNIICVDILRLIFSASATEARNRQHCFTLKLVYLCIYTYFCLYHVKFHITTIIFFLYFRVISIWILWSVVRLDFIHLHLGKEKMQKHVEFLEEKERNENTVASSWICMESIECIKSLNSTMTQSDFLWTWKSFSRIWHKK